MEEIIFEQNIQWIFFLYLLSGIIGAGISAYFFKIYKLFSSSYIFGLIIGFALISFGDFFFSSTVASANQNESFNLFHWLQLSITSYGYAFLSLVYYFHDLHIQKLSIIMKSVLLSIIPIICIMVFVTITENDAVPSFTQYNEYFRIVNMVSIGYIVFRTLSNTDIKNRKILFLIPLGFITLFSSQFVRFLFTIEPETLTLLFSGILKIIALTIILFALTRDSKKKENKELRDG